MTFHALPRSEAQKRQRQIVRSVSMDTIYRVQYRSIHGDIIHFIIFTVTACFLAALFFLICLLSVLGYLSRAQSALVYAGAISGILAAMIMAAIITAGFNMMRRLDPALQCWAKEKAFREKMPWALSEQEKR